MAKKSTAIFETLLHNFRDVLKKVSELVNGLDVPLTSTMQSQSREAVKNLYESMKNMPNLSPEDIEKHCRQFNTLFRESQNLEGLLEVSLKITDHVDEHHMPHPKKVYQKVRKLLDDCDTYSAERLCHYFLEKHKSLDGLPVFDSIYYMSIQYTYGCLKINAGGEKQWAEAQNLFDSYLRNTQTIAPKNFAAAITAVQQVLHAKALAFKNQGQIYHAKICLEQEQKLLDRILEASKKGFMFVFNETTLSESYCQVFRVLMRAHEVLENKDAVEHYSNCAELAEKGYFGDDFPTEKELLRENDQWAEIFSGENVENEYTANALKETLAKHEFFLSDKIGGARSIPYMSREEYDSIENSLILKIEDFLGLEPDAFNDYRFKSEFFDPYRYIEELNSALLSDYDFHSASQDLFRFYRLYLMPLSSGKNPDGEENSEKKLNATDNKNKNLSKKKKTKTKSKEEENDKNYNGMSSNGIQKTDKEATEKN